MPYIKAKHRKELDILIDQLADRLVREAKEYPDPGAFAGLLNYTCTRLALKVVRKQFGQMRYWLIAILSGVFRNVADEFYRRLAAPYEDRLKAENGDVDLFQKYLEDFEKM
jgi:hypothetical protein